MHFRKQKQVLLWWCFQRSKNCWTPVIFVLIVCGFNFLVKQPIDRLTRRSTVSILLLHWLLLECDWRDNWEQKSAIYLLCSNNPLHFQRRLVWKYGSVCTPKRHSMYHKLYRKSLFCKVLCKLVVLQYIDSVQ